MSNEESNTQPTAESAPTPADIPWIQTSEEIPDIYSNFLHLNWTLFDVRIRFAQVIPNPEQPPTIAQWAIDEHATVTMPWGQAKVLRDFLMEAVARYEKANGELKTPVMPT